MRMPKFKTYQIAVQFYRNSQKLHLRNPHRDQFRRAVSSIVLNLAEGSAKPTAKDRKKILLYQSWISQRNTSSIRYDRSY